VFDIVSRLCYSIDKMRLGRQHKERVIMKTTIDGNRYDTDNCEVLGSRDCYNSNNNYSGSVDLLIAKNGTYLVYGNSNGQDCYFNDFLYLFSDSDYSIDDFDLDEDQEKKCAELGLIKII